MCWPAAAVVRPFGLNTASDHGLRKGVLGHGRFGLTVWPSSALLFVGLPFLCCRCVHTAVRCRSSLWSVLTQHAGHHHMVECHTSLCVMAARNMCSFDVGAISSLSFIQWQFKFWAECSVLQGMQGPATGHLTLKSFGQLAPLVVLPSWHLYA